MLNATKADSQAANQRTVRPCKPAREHFPRNVKPRNAIVRQVCRLGFQDSQQFNFVGT
jgi:hypothetical protein